MSEIPLNPRAAAAVFMDEADNDVETAKRLARRRLNDPEFETLRQLALSEYFDLLIDQQWRSGRGIRKKEVAFSPAPYTPERAKVVPVLQRGQVSKPNPQMLRALERQAAGISNYEMPGGTRLFQWSKQRLEDLGRSVTRNAQSALRTGEFFLAVAAMLPKSDSLVGDVLSEADLERLFKKHGLQLTA